MGRNSITVNRKRDDISILAAEIHGVSPRYVQMVRAGDRENEAILTTVMDLLEGKNKLIEEVKKLVPVEKIDKKRAKTTLGDLKKSRNKGTNDPQKTL